MKPKDQKYQEAIERNLPSLKSAKAYYTLVYKKHGLPRIKQMLGIRKTDTEFDAQITEKLGK
jgi:hypothetical protein